ncbi:MAG: LabA-like NYN domain-containing protein [Thermoplasmatota archaeon]
MDSAVLQFRLQEDGRRVARLPSGKVVLVSLREVDRVEDGDWWHVRLEDHTTYAVAHLLGKEAQPKESIVAHPKPMAELVPRPATTQPMFPALRPGEALPEPEDVLARDDRVALFVDSANIGVASRDMGFFIEWKRAKEYFTDPARPYGAFFYVGTEADDPAQGSFLDFLSHAGYVVRSKPVKVMRDRDTGEEVYKANLDVEIALDMMDTVQNWDVAFLFSGDGDFARAVELLRTRGKRVYVVAARSSLARELAHVVDKPIFFLENYRAVLARTDRSPRS